MEDYTEEKMAEMQEAIAACEDSLDFRLNKMAEFLKDTLLKLEEKNKPGKIRFYKVVLGSEIRYYQGETNFKRWFTYHSKKYSKYCKVNGYEFVNGDWVEVV